MPGATTSILATASVRRQLLPHIVRLCNRPPSMSKAAVLRGGRQCLRGNQAQRQLRTLHHHHGGSLAGAMGRAGRRGADAVRQRRCFSGSSLSRQQLRNQQQQNQLLRQQCHQYSSQSSRGGGSGTSRSGGYFGGKATGRGDFFSLQSSSVSKSSASLYSTAAAMVGAASEPLRFVASSLESYETIGADDGRSQGNQRLACSPRSPSSDFDEDEELLDFDVMVDASGMVIDSAGGETARRRSAGALRRLYQWILRVLRACYDAALLTLRGSELALRMSPFVVLTPASIVMENLLDDNGDNVMCDATWWYFTHTMRMLGPAFVKLCQWVATRRDIFPPNVCDRLCTLHDRGSPHSWDHTHEVLTYYFGDYEARGLQVDREQVLGCGSAAQVYKGTLTVADEEDKDRTKTIPVAIKVLHPRFGKLVTRDMWLMQTVADLLHSLPSERIRMLNLPKVASNFGDVLLRQADLHVEAENLKTFRNNFYQQDDHTYDHHVYGDVRSVVHFPCPIDEWTSTEVLVEDLVVDATPISQYLQDDSDHSLAVRKELASPLLRAFLKMVFLDNFVHCDLHPGNVLIQTMPQSSAEEMRQSTGRAAASGLWSIFAGGDIKSSNESVEAEEPTAAELGASKRRAIVFLDAGIATSLDATEQKNLRDLFRAVIMNDGDRAGRLLVERAKFERCSEVEGGVDKFASGIEELVSEFHDRRKEGLTLGHVRVGYLLGQVLDLCRVHGVELDPSMSSIVISTLILEGLGRSLEPSLNLMDFAIPFVLGRGHLY